MRCAFPTFALWKSESTVTRSLAVDPLLSKNARTFKLFKHLGQEQVPLIPYYLTSPRGDEEHNNQPSRYNDKTIIGVAKEGKDNFQVSDSYGGRIMRE